MSDGLEWLICDEPCKVMDARSGCHCAKARDEIARLKAEVERKDAALERLVRAKEEKDKHGDTPVYQALKKSAWESARAALNPSQEPRT